MSHSTLTDRDPTSPVTAALAVQAWLSVLDTHGPRSAQADEADLTLEAALLELGVLSPADRDEGAYFERGAAEHGCVHVRLPVSDSWLELDADGAVSTF